MKKTAKKLLQHCHQVPKATKKWNETELRYRPAEGKWSKKEILGHLIDSAANNHQRFVRAARGEHPVISYAQNEWVAIEDFQNEKTAVLLRLWENYNRHLAHLLLRLSPEQLEKTLEMGGETVSLRFCAEDYLRHLEHHLRQMGFGF